MNVLLDDSLDKKLYAVLLGWETWASPYKISKIFTSLTLAKKYGKLVYMINKNQYSVDGKKCLVMIEKIGKSGRPSTIYWMHEDKWEEF